MAYNTAQRKDVVKAEKRAKLAEQNRREVLVQIMSTIPGREWIWNKLEAAHIFSTPFTTDVNQTTFNLGMQNAGLALLDDVMRSCPDEFILAMREHNARRTDDAARASAGERPGSEDGNGRDQGSAGDPADEGGYAGYVHDLRDEALN